MLIRSFQEGEEAALWQVFHSAVHGIARRDYSAEQVEAWAPPALDPGAWAGRIRAIRPFVAQDEAGAVLGYADLQDSGLIDHFFVAQAAAGQGVGSALMGRIVETALARGMAELFAEVSVTARPLFEAWGFQVQAAQTVVKRGVALAHFRMRKPMPGAEGGEAPVAIVPYDDAWPFRFESERAVLASLLSPWLAGAVHHVGSTAVPGLPAKPVIDIMAAVDSLEASHPAIEAAARAGYLYFPYRPETMHWFCKPSPAHRTHHLHLVPKGSPAWFQRLAFRDALRRNPELAAEYARLKQDLAQKFRLDREAYTAAKAPFIKRVLAGL